MSERLPEQPGEWIDRSKTIQFRFEGQTCAGFAGDTISSALWAQGVRVLGRSFKYHRPRGIYSMANHDANCIVEESAETNIRADVVALREGDFVAVNTFGGVKKDAARFTDWFSSFLPVGFYYKAFHTPRKLFPFWERKMRAMAGLGAINPSAPRVRTPKAYAFCDVLVVGAGPAGLSAALAAGAAGAKVIVVDENARPGGSLTYQWNAEPSASGHLNDLLAQIARHPNIEIRTSTEVGGIYTDFWVALFDAKRLTKLRAKSIIIAAGCFEQPAVFKNNDLPGIMLASAAQRLIHRYAVKPMRRAVVLASNDHAYRAAIDLVKAGIEVAAVVDLQNTARPAGLLRQLAEAKVPVYPQHAIYEAVPSGGKQGITGVRVCPLDAHGEPAPANSFEIACDGVAVSVGWVATDSLINLAGGKMHYSDRVHQFIPKTLPAGVFAAGRVNGVHDLEDQLADGRRAGLASAGHVGVYRGEIPEAPQHDGPAPTHPYPIFEHPKGKEFVDFDEDVKLEDFANAIQEGFDSMELVKRYATVGMGPSQGKLSNMNAARIMARLRNKSLAETGTTTSRPFYHPVPFSHLAGRSFHPHRHTAMHDRHVKAGAVFMPAGAWLRPAYYNGSKNISREQSIQSEVQNVRNGVGMIDVGTLGKIEVNGPDAAEFLERLYTGRFAKMKSGTTRYLLMCDDSGVIIDDGVAARMADDRFYVTATTTGADGVYREMQRWAIVWKMKVTLINYTGAFAAMNLAGPHSRKILAALTNVPTDAESFPYLGFRQGQVAGVPARLLRVGFVGELGYEIHVPALQGGYVWDKIMQQGAAFGIKPFGVEAQRVLRLEKGHIIIGQDTDGLTHPYEAGMEWAVKADKPFFIGGRSLEIVHRKPITRSLVGFALPQDYTGSVPKECHLVIRDGNIVGRVTSVTFSPTLKRVIGMAYVSPDQTQLGNKFVIRVDGGREVHAEVVKTPFYDPDNKRQSASESTSKEAAA